MDSCADTSEINAAPIYMHVYVLQCNTDLLMHFTTLQMFPAYVPSAVAGVIVLLIVMLVANNTPLCVVHGFILDSVTQ